MTSACLGGEVPQCILKGEYQRAREVAKWYKNIFGDDYYLEIQDHGSQEDRIVNVEIVKIARNSTLKSSPPTTPTSFLATTWRPTMPSCVFKPQN